MLGSYGTGKTILLYKMKLGITVNTIPTMGFNVESLQHLTHDYTIYDIGGHEKIKPLWQHYYDDMNLVIYLVDCSRPDTFAECKKDLENLQSTEKL